MDYIATNGVLVFPPGTTTQTISVPVLSDFLNEAFIEQFAFFLFSPTNCAIATPPNAAVSILHRLRRLFLAASPL